MGTDVAYYIEARSGDGPWSLVLNPPELCHYRNTPLFCALGNEGLWRGRTISWNEGKLPDWPEPPPPPLIPPRGWPEDIDVQTRERSGVSDPYGLWGCNWFTLEELEELAPRLPPGEVTKVLMPHMRRLGLPPENVRLLVGFS